MCIISDIIDTVKSTKILVIPSKNGKRQLTVYSNTVVSPESNVMCIPVPNPHSIRLEYVPPDIFSQCNKSFNRWSCMDYLYTFCNSSYKPIIVPSIYDLNNQNGFILSNEVFEFLKIHYPTYGFILCKLKKGKHTYNPVAYSHDMNTTLFIPTKHYYTSIREERDWSFGYVGIKEKKASHMIDDWNHEIYSIATPIWCHESMKKLQTGNKINWYKIPDDYYLDKYININCFEKVGYYLNADIEMPFQLSLLY